MYAVVYERLINVILIFIAIVIVIMEKIVYVTTVLTESEIDALLKRSGESNKKDALRKAVVHYINCDNHVEA
jgi:hypothetical protein